MVGIVEAFKDDGAVGVVGGVEGDILGEGLGGLVELEAREDVEGEALALEREERVGVGPVEELESGGLVPLGFEENVGGCFGGEVGRERW